MNLGGPPPRSWLFVPADSNKKILKALGSGADAVIFDLEDSVAPAQKPIARELLGLLPDRHEGEPQRWVRINPLGTEEHRDDLDLLEDLDIDGVVLPKAQCGDDALCLQDPMAPRTICTAKSGPFGPCNRADMCVDGTYCHSDLDQCLPLGEAGESCDLAGLELPCGPDLLCAYPGPDADAEECVSYVDLGASCSLAPDDIVRPDNCRSYTARCSRESFECVEAPRLGDDELRARFGPPRS